jgi:hypothetical protein
MANLFSNSSIFNQLYKKYVNKDSSMILAVMFSIAAVYIVFYMISSLFKLPLIIISGTLIGLYIHKKYKLSESMKVKGMKAKR